MPDRLLNTEEAVEVALKELEKAPKEVQPNAAAECVNRFAEEGLYDLAAGLLRHFGLQETVIHHFIMGVAKARGDDEALVFELLYAFGGD